MPWLTTHISMPMILAAAWAAGWLVETVPWGKVRDWTGRHYRRAAAIAFLALLAILTVRAAWRAAYINYDNPLEYLVYAHGTPDPKELASEIEELSRRTTGGLDMVVAYDNMVRYPFWWYMRHYTNFIDFDVNPTLDLRRALVIAVGAENYSKIAPVVKNDYNATDGMRLWWPSEDYFSLKWDSIANERAQAPGAANQTPMTILDYLKYAWPHIEPFFTDPKVFNAVWQIWFNRDYTAWAALKKSDAYTLTNWGVSDRMRYYVRKDINAQIWTYTSVAPVVTKPSDPYAALTEPFTADKVVGGPGTQAGQFQAPRQIAQAPDGSLYVADSRNNRIQHLSASGQVVATWGSFADATKGAAPGGTFNEPWGIAIGKDGSVYVADTWNYRIQEFTPDGNFLRMWGTGPGIGPLSFYGPRGLAVDSAGRLLVADTGNKRIVIYSPTGEYLGEFGSAGSGTGELDEPVALAVGEDGRVHVTDTWNQRVQVFAPDAAGLKYTSVATWSVAGWASQSVEEKPFLAVDSQGEVFLTDPEACRVIELDATGKAVHVWGGCGGTGGFTLPDGLALDGSGGLWVGDAGSNDLIHFQAGAATP
jgi:DNA-binding beta-propeller fold protein YncE